MIAVPLLTALVGTAVGYVLSCKTNCSADKMIPGLQPWPEKGEASSGKDVAYQQVNRLPRKSARVNMSGTGPTGAHCVLSLQRHGDQLLYEFTVGTRKVHGSVNLREIVEALKEAQRRVAIKNDLPRHESGFVWFVPLAQGVMELAKNKVVQDAAKKLVSNISKTASSARRGNPRAAQEIRKELQDPGLRPIVQEVLQNQPMPPHGFPDHGPGHHFEYSLPSVAGGCRCAA